MSPPLLLRDARLPDVDGTVDLAVADGRITALAPRLAADGAQVVELAGRTVLPGLWDHHVHATQWASSRVRVDIGDATSPAEAAELVRRAVAAPTFEGDVLIGHGMHHLDWPHPLDRRLLDAAAPGVAVVLQGVDLHTAWANRAALARVGLPDDPTGLLREADCFRAVAVLADGTPAQRDRWVVDAMTAAARRGVTGIRDFEFGDPLVNWQRRLTDHRVDVRIVANVYPEALDAAVGRGLPTGQVVDGTRGQLRIGHCKLFVDGALNSRTALCHHPYPGGGPDDRGALVSSPAELVATMTRAVGAGIRPAVHAIGDRAVGVALDALEQVGGPGRIEHAQLVAREDLARLAAPGLVVGVQPAHLLEDRQPADRLWAGRTDRAFALADLAGLGARLEFGSDAPVAPLDPWRGIAAAVARTDDDQPPWHPEQALDVRTALRATCGGRLQLALGDLADLVVLDDDPLRCAPATLRAPSVHATMLAGRWTHGPVE